MVTERIAIIAALEALGDGDQELAAAILLAALESGSVTDPRRLTRCQRPGCLFRGWPGEVERHALVSHTEPMLAPARPPRRLVRSTTRARS